MRIQLVIYALVKTGGIDKTQNISSDKYEGHHHIDVYYGFLNAVSVALYHLMHTASNKMMWIKNNAARINITWVFYQTLNYLWPLLLTWVNFNPSMDK